ncbi:hypothetical protein CRG98_006852 [Punica granatum]|uniref:Uncharacterized protein n=1 Tax=Punica granatum TaxID=22663 RepID=A0A2I0KWC5_PUNGR|nr:hypothetical protein CRG98_006852 [Punica granatum]
MELADKLRAKENPIRILYQQGGHYDVVLRIPGRKRGNKNWKGKKWPEESEEMVLKT